MAKSKTSRPTTSRLSILQQQQRFPCRVYLQGLYRWVSFSICTSSEWILPRLLHGIPLRSSPILKTYLPLLIFPLLVILTSIISMRMANWLKPGYKEQKEAKEREKKNPARAGQTPTDQAEMTTKMMSWMMPVLMLFTTFTLPAAMGLYWVVGSIMGIITQLLTYFMFTKPYELKKLEMEQKKAEAFKKNFC